MKRQPIAVRVLSGFTALTMLMQPVLAATTGLTSARQLQEGLISSGVFQNANAPEADSLAAVWGDYLAVFESKAPVLRENLANDSVLIGAMQEQLARWDALRAGLRTEGDAAKLAESVEKLSQLLKTSLARRQGTINELQGHVDSIAATASTLAQNGNTDARVFAEVYEFDMAAGVWDSERALANRAWSSLVLAQAAILEQIDASDVQRQAAVTLQASLTEAAEAVEARMESWNNARAALAGASANPHKRIDHQREAGLLEASRRLVDKSLAGLRDKPDANSRAHAQMVRRFGSIVERRTEQLAALATERVAGLHESAFLQIAVADKLDGVWAVHARNHEEIGRRLVTDLEAADGVFDGLRQGAEQAIAEARAVVGGVARAEAPPEATSFAAMRERLGDLDTELARHELALRQLDVLRRNLLAQAAPDGQAPFKTPDLRNRNEAIAYATLGQVYELAHALFLATRVEISNVETHAAAARAMGVVSETKRLIETVEAFDRDLGRWAEVTASQQANLEQLRQLSLRVTGDYSRDLNAFADTLSDAAEASQGPYSKVVASMQSWIARGAATVNGMTSPIIEAVAGNPPRIAAPRVSWTGTSTLDGALKRTIERGSYFRSTGKSDLALLGEQNETTDIADFTSSLALVDLAMAMDYPMRTFVAPDGMVIIVGTDGPGAAIRGIGNPEQYRLDPNAPQASIIPDFSVSGTLVGWNLWGDFQNFCTDAGQAIGTTVQSVGTAAGQVVQGAQQFGAQIVDAVGPTIQTYVDLHVEVARFAADTAGNFGQSFIDDPWKIVTYAGYGAAIVLTGGAATPFVVVAIAADVGKSAVKTAEQRAWIDKDTAALATLGLDVVQIVSGGVAGGQALGATGMASKAIHLAQLGVCVSTAGKVELSLANYAEGVGLIDAETAAWLRVVGGTASIVGGVMTAGGLIEGLTGAGNVGNLLHNVHGLASGALPAGFTKAVIADAIIRGGDFLDLIHGYTEMAGYLSDAFGHALAVNQRVPGYEAPAPFQPPTPPTIIPYKGPGR